MTAPKTSSLRQLGTGIPGLDLILGGGIPELSFNLIIGGPGCGKTTLVHQIMFANATPERPALYFTVLGEPALKMLRYQQLFSFFDPAKVQSSIRFVSLADQAMEQGLGSVLESIIREIEATHPGIVVVDSFRSTMHGVGDSPSGAREQQEFVQKLAQHLTAWEATSFLIGEFRDADTPDHPVYTVADGLMVLSQRVERNSVVRKVQIMKMRGQNDLPGLHSYRITGDGLKVFPRLPKPLEEADTDAHADHEVKRLSTGVPALDEMLDGGIPRGYAILLAGPSGSGKTVLASQFITEGVKRGEHGVIALFEKRPGAYLETTSLGQDLEKMRWAGDLAIVYLRPLDLSVDETLYELQETITRTGAKRLVIDSLSGFELAVSPGFREDFRESLYRLVGVLNELGTTVIMTLEVENSYTELRLGPRENAFIADGIILQRYAELGGELKRIITVVKLRASDHSHDLRLYDIDSHGLRILGKASGSNALLIGGRRSSGSEGE